MSEAEDVSAETLESSRYTMTRRRFEEPQLRRVLVR